MHCRFYFRYLLLPLGAMSFDVFFGDPLMCKENASRYPTAHAEVLVDSASNDFSNVHVVYMVNFKAFPGLLSSMMSLARHLRDPARCQIHLIVPSRDMSLARRVGDCFRAEFELEFPHHMSVGPSIHFYELRPTRCVNKFIRDPELKALLFERFYLHEYLPSFIRRVIFLDADTIVKSDVAVLFKTPMKHPIAGVRGGNSARTNWKSLVASSLDPKLLRLFRDPSQPYLSLGVSVYDLARWRSGRVTRGLERWARRFPWTQNELEIMQVEFQNRSDHLDWRWHVWNLGCHKPITWRCQREARILHWSGPCKPWSMPRYPPCVNNDIFHKYGSRKICEALQ